MGDQILLDGLALNDENPWRILNGTFNFQPARKKLNWIDSPLSDGAALSGSEDHYENAEMTFRLRMETQTFKDSALDQLHALTAKLQEARRTQGGLPMVWIPSGATRGLTFYVIDAEYDEIPTEYESGWSTGAPQVVCHLYLRPFGYDVEQLAELGWSDSFRWDGITGGRWRYDSTTSGTVSISLGAMIPSSAAQKRLYLPFQTTDAAISMRVKLGATITGGTTSVAPFARYTVANGGHIRGGIACAQPGLRIQKSDGATSTTLASTNYTVVANTIYWMMTRFDGDVITTSLYADGDDPLRVDGLTPLASVSYTLAAGTESDTYGADVLGNLGFHWSPASTDWLIDQYTVRGMRSVKSSEPVVFFELPEIPGHVAAEGRQVVTEGGAKNQSHYEWGLEARDYDLVYTPPLILDSAVLTTSGFAGTQATGTNKYDPDGTGTNMIQSDGLDSDVAVTVCGTGTQTHTGTYKVKARVSGDLGIRFRLAWRAGDGRYIRNNYSPGLIQNSSQEIDLGTIVIPRVVVGSQAWDGRLEAYSPDTANGVLTVDYLELIPLERYGVAKAPLAPITGDVFAARDAFNQASNPALTPNNIPLDVGGNWQVSGQTVDGTHPDFTVDSTNHWLKRTAPGAANLNSGRYALAGTTNYAAVQVEAVIATLEGAAAVAFTFRSGIVLRYVDANNWFMAVREGPTISNNNTSVCRLRVYKRVAGTVTLLGDKSENALSTIHRRIICSISATGVWQVYDFWTGQNQPSTPTLSGEDSVLATGNTLQNGKIGLYDAYISASPTLTRTFDNFTAFAATSDAVLYASKHLEIRSDRAEREAASGTVYGRVPQYRAQRFYVPASGDAGTVARMVVKDRRNNVDEGLPDSSPFTDPLTIQVYTTPRYLTPVGPNE